MGIFSDWKASAEAKLVEQFENYARDKALQTIKANLKLENLPKLKRVLLLAANQQLVETAWPRLEGVVTKFGSPGFSLIGKQNVTPEIHKLVFEAVKSATNVACDDATVVAETRKFFGHEQLERAFTFEMPRLIWRNGEISGNFQKLINNEERCKELFDILVPSTITEEDGYRGDDLFYLSHLTPILALYFVLTFLSDSEKIMKLHPFMDLLVKGVVPHSIERSPQVAKLYVVVE